MFCASALPITGAACWNPGMEPDQLEQAQRVEMLSGRALGDALREAMRLKGVKQGDVASEFEVAQSSVSEWIKFGRIAKKHIPHLVSYFSSHVGPTHWGLPDSWGQAANMLLVEEVELLFHFRKIRSDAKQQALGFLKGLAASTPVVPPDVTGAAPASFRSAVASELANALPAPAKKRRGAQDRGVSSASRVRAPKS